MAFSSIPNTIESPLFVFHCGLGSYFFCAMSSVSTGIIFLHEIRVVVVEIVYTCCTFAQV